MSDEPVRQEQEEPISEDRRQAMKKLGKYGLYTAPALLAVLDAAQANNVVSGFVGPP